MRRLICSDCGEKFSEEDAEVRSENVGEFWGAPAYMDYNICPYCGSDDVDTYYGDDEEED